MPQGRNVGFIAVCAAILCITVVFAALKTSGIVSHSGSGLGGDRSYLEARKYATLPKVSLEGAMDGSFQSDFDSYLVDSIPFREEVLLANAQIQRAAISGAAALFGYDIYPTFYNSKYQYSVSKNRLYAKPLSQSKSINSKMNAIAGSLNQFAANHPGYRYFMCRAVSSDDLGLGALGQLVAHPVGYDYLTGVFEDRLSADFRVVDIAPSSLDEYDQLYYRTDHHPNIEGSYRIYAHIAEALGFGDELLGHGDLIQYIEPPFYGSASKNGLMTGDLFDYLTDYDFALPELEVWVLGTREDYDFVCSREAYAAGMWSDETYINRYAEYFHGNDGIFLMINSQMEEGDSLLIVGDSFSNPIERLFLQHYRRVYSYDPRTAPITLDEFLAKYTDVDDIVFLSTYSVLTDPSFISVLG